MREILFKAKRIDNAQEVEGYYVCRIKRTPCPIGDCLKPGDQEHLIVFNSFSDWNMPRELKCVEIDTETLCQFTGSVDANGNREWEECGGPVL